MSDMNAHISEWMKETEESQLLCHQEFDWLET